MKVMYKYFPSTSKQVMSLCHTWLTPVKDSLPAGCRSGLRPCCPWCGWDSSFAPRTISAHGKSSRNGPCRGLRVSSYSRCPSHPLSDGPALTCSTITETQPSSSILRSEAALCWCTACLLIFSVLYSMFSEYGYSCLWPRNHWMAGCRIFF